MACSLTTSPPDALVRKLGVRPGDRVCVLGQQGAWLAACLPDCVDVRRRLQPARVVILLCHAQPALVRQVQRCAGAIHPDGMLWVAWPRRAAGHRSDLDENRIRSVCLPIGLVDVKVAALSHDWSGLKLVWRRSRRETPG